MSNTAHPADSDDSHADRNLLRRLRHVRPARRGPPARTGTPGQRVADWVSNLVGSWRFIIGQSVLLVIWIVLNVLAFIQHWDPYPFILLNLFLSFQAAYTAPIIMMSQNRQSEIDRRHAEHDFEVNVKAELEIELLHEKVDLLREQQLSKLIEIVERLESRLEAAPKPREASP